MAGTSDLISMLKKELNSILLSAGTEVTLRQLEVDYRDLIGKPIPYREAGHTSLEELVLNMPDAVMTRWWNGELKLRAITNVCNEHVAKLVSLSKKKPKTSYRINKKSHLPGTYQQPQFSNAIMQNNVVNNKSTNLTRAETNADYNMLRGEILNLMLGYRYGLPGSKFAEAFAKRYGNYRKLSDSGFPSILALLQSMLDVVDIEFHENNKDFTVHGKLGRKKVNGNGIIPPQQGNYPYKENNLIDDRSKQEKNWDSADVISEIPGSLAKNVNGKENQLAEMPNDDEEDGSEYWSEEINEMVTGDLKTNIQRVLSLHPNGLYASKFVAEYKKIHGTKLSVKKFGYQTVIELVADMPEIAVIERPANGDWLVFDKRTYRKELVSQVVRLKGRYLPPTPSLFNFRHSLQTILEANPAGVPLNDLETIYENFIHQSINPSLLGFANLDRLLESVTDIVDVEYMGEGRVIVTPVRTTENMWNRIQTIRNDDLSLAPFLPTTQSSLPKDAVLHGHIYAKQDPPMPSTNYIEVLVSEVRHPKHFWFQLAKTKSVLNDLMDNLQVFYQHPSAKNYAIPSEMMRAGLACVGQYPENQEWHRCVILRIKEEFAKVSYVDYGTEGFICKKSLRLITWPFLSALPAQSVLGRLSKIAPVGDSWTQAAIDYFFNLVVDRELAARITNVSKDVPFIVSVCLCDTSGKEDIHINDHLIQEQHARLSVTEVQEESAVANVKEDVVTADYEWIVHNDVDDYDDYEFSSYESDVEPEVVNSEPTAAFASLPHDDKVNETGHLLKFVQLTPEYSFHLVNIDEKAYVISSEVSSFFWKEDIIRQMLRNRGKANIPKIVLTKEEHGEILCQLYDACLPGTSGGGMPSQMVVLYELSSIVDILELFRHPSEELKMAVQQQLDLFNSRDSYWTGKKELELDEKSPAFEQDFREAWNDLQTARESALRRMKNASPLEMASLVGKIEDIEEKLEMLKLHFEQSTDKNSASVLSFGSSKDLSVDRIILQQGRSYLKQNGAELSSSASRSTGSSDDSRLILSTTNEETSRAVNSSAHFPAVSLPVLLTGVSNLGVNLFPNSSEQTTSSLTVHSSGNSCQLLPNHDCANALASSMTSLSVGDIQTPVPSFPTATGFPRSGATYLPYSSDYQVPINNGFVSSLPLILNSSILPGFNPLQYNPMLIGSMPYPTAGPLYVPGPYHGNGLLHTPGLLPSLSIYTRLAGGGFPSGLTLPNAYVAGNQNLPNVSH